MYDIDTVIVFIIGHLGPVHSTCICPRETTFVLKTPCTCSQDHNTTIYVLSVLMLSVPISP